MRRMVCPIILLLPCVIPNHGDAGVPVIYSTDLYHPHDDPDDHYDLATLFALPELDVKGVIIDMANIGEISERQTTGKRPGIVALQQVFHMTGKTVPVTLGLDQPLRSADDEARGQSNTAQGGVHLILSTLQAAREKVSLFTVGSLRDVAAAYNRDPELLRTKVRAIYINAGTGPAGYQEEWNVRLDPTAYRRILLSDLPIRWYPCFGQDTYLTYFRVDQREVVGGCTAPLKAYFDYALTRSKDDPIKYLAKSCSAPMGPRNMWCTPSFIDLAGRKIYRTSSGFEALAKPPTASATPIECYEMVPVKIVPGKVGYLPPATGKEIAGYYIGSTKDVVGKSHLEPDGIPDCQVQIRGLPQQKKIQSARLTGPQEGVWLSQQDPQRWRLKTEWQGADLTLSFTYWAAGSHQLTITFSDGQRQSISFHVPPPNSPLFEADLSVEDSSIHVMRKKEPAYTETMTSCLKNLLESFPINTPQAPPNALESH